jgi:type II secretory pathway component GspD/PulD (secretin)
VIPPQATGTLNYTPLVRRKRIQTDARIANGGTIVLGGWTGERSQELTSGVPVLRNMPYIGKMLFSRNTWNRDRTTLLIFLTAFMVD